MTQSVGHTEATTEAERRVDDRSLVVSEASGQPQSTVWSEKTVVLDFWRNLLQYCEKRAKLEDARVAIKQHQCQQIQGASISMELKR